MTDSELLAEIHHLTLDYIKQVIDRETFADGLSELLEASGRIGSSSRTGCQWK